MSLELKLFLKIFKFGVDLAQICYCFVTSLFQILFAWCNVRICPGLGTDLAQKYTKSVPTTFCLVSLCTGHGLGTDFVLLCAKSVPTPYQILHVSYNS